MIDIALKKRDVGDPSWETRSFALTKESGEISIETNSAPGLFLASIVVWAPTPHAASSTLLPGE